MPQFAGAARVPPGAPPARDTSCVRSRGTARRRAAWRRPPPGLGPRSGAVQHGEDRTALARTEGPGRRPPPGRGRTRGGEHTRRPSRRIWRGSGCWRRSPLSRWIRSPAQDPHISDVAGLPGRQTIQARQMLRKLLADKIELEPLGSGRQRSYKFRGALSLEHRGRGDD